jgi:hypothetical protein
MSVPSYRQAKAFLAPLQRKVTIFLVEGRESHLILARFLLDCICITDKTATVLDTNTTYASNSVMLASNLGESCLENITLLIPSQGPTKSALANSIFSTYDVLIVDDLNTLYHLLSTEDRSAIRELTAITKILSYFCRENGKTAFLTAYSAGESLKREGGQRSLFRMGDLSVSTSVDDSIRFRCDHGAAWPNNTFSVSL